MFSHVTVGSNDIARARRFYDGIADALGLVRHADHADAAGYGPPGGRAQLWIVRPLDKNPATVGNGITIGLEATNRTAVDAAHAAALAAGGAVRRVHLWTLCAQAGCRRPPKRGAVTSATCRAPDPARACSRRARGRAERHASCRPAALPAPSRRWLNGFVGDDAPQPSRRRPNGRECS